MLRQAFLQRGGRAIAGGVADHDDEIAGRQCAALLPETFPDDALDAIAVHGTPDIFARGDQAEPRFAAAIDQREQREAGIALALAAGKHPLELMRMLYPRGSGENKSRQNEKRPAARGRDGKI